MSGGRQGKGNKASTGTFPTQKLGRHHSFASSTEDSSKPGSPGNPYVDGSNVAKSSAMGKGSGTKGRPDAKTKTPRIPEEPAAGSSDKGWKQSGWS